jgi:signal transduction histidine kinase
MKIRTRLTLWFTSILLLGMMAISSWSYYDFVIEHRNQHRVAPPSAAGKDELEESPLVDVAEVALYCGLPALALAIGGGWWMMRKALSPVTDLSAAAERINEHHLAERLQRSGNGDELDRLTEVFNAMIERLQASFRRMREFTLHASHELKTPLTVMHGELETWLRDEGVAGEHRERIENALDEVQRLAKIVDGLTLLTKADAGQASLQWEPVQLDDLVREAYLDAQSLARPAGVSVGLGPCCQILLQGDRHRLRQLLLNLCDNAVKYNARGGTVTLELDRVGDGAELRISNTGQGIEPEVLPRIFEPFFRGDASHSQAIEGCGLGLSIARWIVNAHGGMIEVRSEPGKLTTAVVRLPAPNVIGNGDSVAPGPSRVLRVPVQNLKPESIV